MILGGKKAAIQFAYNLRKLWNNEGPNAKLEKEVIRLFLVWFNLREEESLLRLNLVPFLRL